jgi:hypothetical protein
MLTERKKLAEALGGSNPGLTRSPPMPVIQILREWLVQSKRQEDYAREDERYDAAPEETQEKTQESEKTQEPQMIKPYTTLLQDREIQFDILAKLQSQLPLPNGQNQPNVNAMRLHRFNPGSFFPGVTVDEVSRRHYHYPSFSGYL